MLSNSHLFEEEVIANAEGESRWSRATGSTIGTATLAEAIAAQEKATTNTGDTVAPRIPAGENLAPAPLAPAQEAAPVAEQPISQPATQPSTGGSTGGTVTLQPATQPQVIVNVGEAKEATPIAMVDPVVGIGSPIIDPVTEQPIGSVGGGGLFGGGGGGMSRSEEEGIDEGMPVEQGGSNWWIWAVLGVAVVGGIVVFYKNGSKFKMPEIIK